MTMIIAVISLRSSLGLLYLGGGGVQKTRWLSSKGWKATRRKPRICYWDALGAERILNPAEVLETHLHLPLNLSPGNLEERCPAENFLFGEGKPVEGCKMGMGTGLRSESNTLGTHLTFQLL